MKKSLFAALAFLFTVNLSAQTADFNGVKRVTSSSLRSIVENNEVKGYYMFLFVDKANRKENIYELQFLDNSLKKTHSAELVKPKNYFLLESAFNGSHFCFSFYNPKKKSIEYVVMDGKGKVTGTYTVLDLTQQEIMMISQTTQSEDNIYSGGLSGVDGKGFVRYGYEKEKGLRVSIDFFDNLGNKGWSALSGASKESKSFEGAIPYFANGEVIASFLTTRAKLMSKDVDSDLVFHSAANGKELFRLKCEDKYITWPMGVSYDNETKEYFIFGEYYNKTDNPIKDDSQGFFLQTVNPSGKITKESFSHWENDVMKKLSITDKSKMPKNVSVCMHKMIRTADGKIYAIGEQFKKAVSGLGVAAAVIGGGNSNVALLKAELYNMMLFEFDNSLSISKVSIYEKDKTNVELPQGFGMLGTVVLGYYMRQYGWFDYAFTAISTDRKQFNSAYVNFDRGKGARKYVVGNIALNKENQIKTDVVSLSSKPTWFSVFPSKPGYVAVFEYFRKEKKATVRLEKLNID